MNDGLREKYIVRKAETGETVENCFVLRPEKDPAAIAAIRAYATATNNPALSADLLRWVGSLPNDPLTLDELREMDGEPVFIIHNEYGKSWCIIDWHGVNKSWCYFSKTGTAEGMTAVPVTAATYGETWLAFRRKPEEA